MNSVHFATPGDDFHSLAVVQHAASTACPRVCSSAYPCAATARRWSVVEGIEHDDFAQGKIAVTTKELVDERDEVRALGLGS